MLAVPMDPPADPPASPTHQSCIVKGKGKAEPRGTKRQAVADPELIDDSDNDDFQACNALEDEEEMEGNGGNESTPQKGKAGLSHAKCLPQVEVEVPSSWSHSCLAPHPCIETVQADSTKDKLVVAVAVRKVY
jgi:hypothetical protein